MTAIAPRPRRTFPEISAVSWEHPADRAALQSLRAVPGVDEVIRKLIAFLGGERGIRLLFQGNAVRVSAAQYPRLHALHVEVCTTFDLATPPQLFVSQTPIFNAGTYGVDDPFIVLHSAAIEVLDEDELRTLLAHELGHVISGHALYSTMAAILAAVSLGALPFLAGIALLPVRLAFLEWSRKAELSADRAGLLGSQDPVAAQRVFMKMAGGTRGQFASGELNVDAYMAQANEYLQATEGLDLIYKLVNTLGLSHPMHTVRAAELQAWIQSGEYDRILRGEYVRRGHEQKARPLGDDVRAATEHYAAEARDFAENVAKAAKEAAGRVQEAFRAGSARPS